MTETHDERASLDNGGSVRNPSAFSGFDSKETGRVHKKTPRKPVSCVPCRKSKLRCNRQLPCASCQRRECLELCTYTYFDSSTQHTTANHVDGLEARSTSTRQSPHSGNPIGTTGQDRNEVEFHRSEATLDTIGNPSQTTRQDNSHTEWDALLQRPMDQMCPPESRPDDPFINTGNFCFPFSFGPAVSREEILAILPPSQCCDYLVTEYFIRLSPLFHILHGPTFQKQYNYFRQNPGAADLSWIALLFAICSATINTFDSDESRSIDIWPEASGPRDLSSDAYRLRIAAMICLSKDQFLIRHNLSTLEALLLLIYTISNHEGAERAWTLLGMTLFIIPQF